jgi:hypothetical protein
VTRDRHQNAGRAPQQDGFVLLVLLGLVAATAAGVVLAAGHFVPALARRAALADARLDALEAAAREQFRRDGAFAADLDALATAAWLEPDGAWRLDPWSAAQPFVWQRNANGLLVRSCGPDRGHGTADDVTRVVAAEAMVRTRQRSRLRLLRAVFAASPYRSAPTMSSTERATMRAALRDHAQARRAMWQADTAARAAAIATMATTAATVEALVAAHACPALPVALQGAGGLFEGLGLSTALAVDGAGAALRLDPVLGCVAVGSDGVGGTDDDM